MYLYNMYSFSGMKNLSQPYLLLHVLLLHANYRNCVSSIKKIGIEMIIHLNSSKVEKYK